MKTNFQGYTIETLRLRNSVEAQCKELKSPIFTVAESASRQALRICTGNYRHPDHELDLCEEDAVQECKIWIRRELFKRDSLKYKQEK